MASIVWKIALLVAAWAVRGAPPSNAASDGGVEDDIVLALLLPVTGSWSVGSTIAGAMSVAVDTVNSDPDILPGRNLSFVWNDTRCDAKTGLSETVNMWLQVSGLHAFIGGGCDVVCEPSGLLASSWNIPMISWGCSSMELSKKDVYTTLVRTVGPYIKMTPMFTGIMQHFDWTRAAILTSSETVWQTASYAVKLELEDNDIFVSEFYTFSPGHEDISGKEKSQHLDLLRSSKDSTRIYLLFAFGGDIRDLMLNAYDLGLLNGEYVFVCVDLLAEASIGENTWMGNDGRDGEALAAFEGILNIHIKTPISPSYTVFMEEVRERTAMEPFNIAVDPNKEIDVHAGPLFDAVLLFALALHAVIENGGDEYDGKAVTNMMVGSRFVGVDGNVTIDENGDRDPDYALQDVHDSVFEDFAFYDHETKILEFLPDFIPVWPGGSTTTPTGEPVCGWDNENCQTNTVAIVVGVSCAVLLIAIVIGAMMFYFYRHFKRESTLQSLNLWRVIYQDIAIGTNKTSSFNSAISKSRSSYGPSLGSNPNVGGRSTAMSTATTLSQKFCSYGVYRGSTVAIKHIDKKNIALTRDLLIEMHIARTLKHDAINPFIGACIDYPNICILTEYSHKGSLQDVLENDDIKLDDNFKMSFAMDICKGLQYLTTTELKSHGRLKSSNCLIDKRWSCKLTDHGLAIFRNTPISQSNNLDELYKASLWTAPELLRYPPPGPYGSPEGDIYALGIILQEIVLRGGPYCAQSLDPQEIVTAVKLGARPVFRPFVPHEACSQLMMELMMSCWAEKIADRPSLSKIKHMIMKLSGGKGQNLVDNMIGMMEKYADHLEELVNERTGQLEEEKKKTDQLLHQMLPRSVAAQLKRGDVVTAEQYEQVTVYFSDIVGFTKIASESTPFQVVELLNDLYTLFDDTIGHYDIYKVETIGDAYMVASGVPERNGNRHAAEIGNMALDLLNSVKFFKMRHRPHEPIQLRIGIHTGPVVAGVVGQKMPRFCLFGDTVNTASRMESNGRALRIHISSTTQAILTLIGGFVIELRGEITVKGKDVMTTYWLINRDKSADTDLPDLCLPVSPNDRSDDDTLPIAVWNPDRPDAY